jgi:hypothetical protein
MQSSGTITLFTQRADLGPQPASFAVSVLVHGVAIAIAWFAIAYKPPFTRVVTDRYTVRKLDLHAPDMERLAASARIPYPASHSSSRPPAPSSPGSSLPSPAALPQTAQAKLGPQTLIQPDLPKPITLTQEIPLPQVVIWSPTKIQVKTVTPPLPQKPTSADVKPSVIAPNQELTLADVNIASTFHPSPKNIVQPSTTSPVSTHVPLQVQMPPVTSSISTVQPTPVAMLSLSDLRAKNVTVNLPPVNETKASNTQGVGAPGQAQKSTSAQGSPAAKSTGTGAGQGTATKTNNPGAGAGQGQVAKVTNPGTGAGQGNDAKSNNSGPGASNGKPGPAQSGPAQSAPGQSGPTPSAAAQNSGSDQDIMPGATLVTVPKDGRFGSVIVGDSLQDRYPEIADVWSGRLTYSAYLHVGLAKSWILQYSLPRSADAASAGTVARLDAPWPYNIVRPNLEPGSIDADALMIHGFVNQTGRFEALSIVFPEGFPKAQFVLAALQQWQFRPASQDGQSARVEVLLIIPENYE